LVTADTAIINYLLSMYPQLTVLQIPKKNIYQDKEDITNKISTFVNKNTGSSKPTILLAAGPIGKIIALNMHTGAQFVDIGHGLTLLANKPIIIVQDS